MHSDSFFHGESDSVMENRLSAIETPLEVKKRPPRTLVDSDYIRGRHFSSHVSHSCTSHVVCNHWVETDSIVRVYGAFKERDSVKNEANIHVQSSRSAFIAA